MPIYEYTCKKCRSAFEVLLRSKDEAVECPSCRSDNVAKLFSAFAVQSSGPREVSAGTGSSCGSCAGGNCSSCH